MERYVGGCHCGAVRFEASLDLSHSLECNCSHCSKKGFILSFTPREHFTILQGKESLTSYFFNKKAIEHQFCSTCGVEAFGLGTGPDGTLMAAVNVRCLDGVDLGSLKPESFDGASR